MTTVTGWTCPKCGRVNAPTVAQCAGPHRAATRTGKVDLSDFAGFVARHLGGEVRLPPKRTDEDGDGQAGEVD